MIITRVNITAGDGLTGNCGHNQVRTLKQLTLEQEVITIANADDIVLDAQQLQQQVKLLLETVQVMLPQTILLVQPRFPYADLAENYLADSNYAPGTVVEFGGSAEVTASSGESSSSSRCC